MSDNYTVPEIIKLTDNIHCEHCLKSITTKLNLLKHLKICKVKKTNLEEENRILKKISGYRSTC